MKKLDALIKGLKSFILLIAIGAFVILSSAFGSNYFEISKNLEIFTSLYQELNIYYVDETKPGSLMKTGIDAMLRSLDPYTVYYPESKIEDYRFMTTGQYGGIGALIQTIDDEVVITAPYEGFAAQKAGLMAGDVLLKVDGQDISNRTQDEISDILKGQAGTIVKLEIRRKGDPSPRIIELSREEVKIPDVPYFDMIDDKTGYIKLSGFKQTASAEVIAAYKDLHDNKGMEQMILDLRGNGGGLLREAINIVNMFVPKGQEIVSTRGKLKDWNKTHIALNNPIVPDMPLIVLIDGRSASASEIVSGALQDLDRAVVLGNRSFGKGLVQQTKDLSYNTKLKLTVAKYYIPSGRCIQKLDYSHRANNGIVEEVPDSLIKRFKTLGGRTVYDGRGIQPDLEIEADAMGSVLTGMIANNVIFNWATDYRISHPQISEAADFRLTETEYQEFADFANDIPFEYDTRTEELFKQLEKVAKEEKYYTGAEGQFEALSSSVLPSKKNDLIKFKDQIKDFLESEIVSRYYFQSGQIKHSLSVDPQIEQALTVFSSTYDSILSGTTQN